MVRIFVVILFLSIRVMSQDAQRMDDIVNFQIELNKKFESEDTSPLSLKDLKEFKGLDFFEIDTTFQVEAKFVRTPYETPFIMQTTSGREPLYVKYGEAHFTLLDKEVVLEIYQNQGLLSQPEFKDYLFLPFTDLTNGDTSYAGGRFIDLRIPNSDTIHIDFNQAYNPYCAYNERYSCPIPPAQNHIDLKIPVGVRKYQNKTLTNN